MSFYGRWIAASAAGELVGIGTGAAATTFINTTVGKEQTTITIVIHTRARPAFVRPEVGAIPVRLAAHPNLSELSGRFFDRCE